MRADDFCRSGRGNVFLDSALPLTKSLHRGIVSLGQRMENTVSHIEQTKNPVPEEGNQIAEIIVDTKELLEQIDREIPLLQLAITASGESLSSSLPPGISPSRLLQASTLLTFGDNQFSQTPDQMVQVGPGFCLSLYMLFLGHAPHSRKPNCAGGEATGPYGIEEQDRKPIWQEVIHKARVRLVRAPVQQSHSGNGPNPEYHYRLDIVEDRDDGRVHETTQATSLGSGLGPRQQMLRMEEPSHVLEESIPVHQISKIFYTDSGRLLNIGDHSQDAKKPVLLLKRDVNGKRSTQEFDELTKYSIDDRVAEQRPLSEDDNTQAELDRQLLGESIPILEDQPCSKGFPRHLDPEWIAMEMYEDIMDKDECSSEASDSDLEETHGEIAWTSAELKRSCEAKTRPPGAEIEARTRKLSLCSGDEVDSAAASAEAPNLRVVARSPFGGITTSLSLIEMLTRLAGLQEFQQTSHLTIPDHILTFFLEETSTTGLVGEAQWRARKEARAHVGFDPYSDSAAQQQ